MASGDLDAQAHTHLNLIAQIGDAFAKAGVSWWLYGGWAMDFHAGRVTRPHIDIEFFVNIEEAAIAMTALMESGFLAPSGLHPDEGQPFLKDGVELGMWYLQRRPDGSTTVPGRWSDWPFPAHSFDGGPGKISNVVAPVMSLDGLLDMKERFAVHPHGAPLRPKDESDIEFLRELRART